MSTSTRATERNTLARVLRVRSGKLSATSLHHLVRTFRAGGVVIFPTETVYGIGASAFSPAGIRRIYQLKGRRWTKPLALLVPALEAARPLVEFLPAEAFRLARAFWPGPLTLVLPASPLGRLITGGLTTIGVRVPRHPVPLAILQALDVPLATTSVNRSGHEPAISGVAAIKRFGSKVDWVVDGGTCTLQEASSVVDLSHFPFTVKRQGAIAKQTLEKTLFQPA